MAPSNADLRTRLAADFPAIPPSILDTVMAVFEQDPMFLKELVRDLQKRERRGRAAQQPPQNPPREPAIKSVKIQPFEEFMQENPAVFGHIYEADGAPKVTLEAVEDSSVPPTVNDHAEAAEQ